jgi:hypothetical protein
MRRWVVLLRNAQSIAPSRNNFFVRYNIGFARGTEPAHVICNHAASLHVIAAKVYYFVLPLYSQSRWTNLLQ